MLTTLFEMKKALRILCKIFLIEIFFISCVNCVDSYARNTTSSKPELGDDFEIMKPTTLARRFNVDSNASDTFLPRSLVKARPKNRNKTTSEVWEWDHRCQRQPIIGRCNEALPRYFYEVSRKECVKFTYSGCDGNSNNFKSIYDCEKNCKGTFPPVINATDNSFCALQPNAGACFDILERFYFDINRRSCVKFIYGGCGGNDNNFEYEGNCNKVCENVFVEESKENLRQGDNEWSSDSD